jgi:hypothetical protein
MSQRPLEPPDEPERSSDPAFDLRQGLVVLLAVIAIMVTITIVCIVLAER